MMSGYQNMVTSVPHSDLLFQYLAYNVIHFRTCIEKLNIFKAGLYAAYIIPGPKWQTVSFPFCINSFV